MISFWYGVKRMRSEPAAAARSATWVSSVPVTRPAIGATPTAFRPFLVRCTPTWSTVCLTGSGAGPSISGRLRYSSSSTFRNFSVPQSLIRNFRRALDRSRR